jgi:hypothetical protein
MLKFFFSRLSLAEMVSRGEKGGRFGSRPNWMYPRRTLNDGFPEGWFPWLLVGNDALLGMVLVRWVRRWKGGWRNCSSLVSVPYGVGWRDPICFALKHRKKSNRLTDFDYVVTCHDNENFRYLPDLRKNVPLNLFLFYFGYFYSVNSKRFTFTLTLAVLPE